MGAPLILYPVTLSCPSHHISFFTVQKYIKTWLLSIKFNWNQEKGRLQQSISPKLGNLKQSGLMNSTAGKKKNV